MLALRLHCPRTSHLHHLSWVGSGRAAHQPGADTGYSVLLADRRDDAQWTRVRNLTADFKGVKQVGAHSSQVCTIARAEYSCLNV